MRGGERVARLGEPTQSDLRGDANGVGCAFGLFPNRPDPVV